MRALLVSYAFPPVGGAGVQRMLKLAKYLPEHGVTPTVLTVKNPSVPLLDPSLLSELPAGLEVERARTLEPAYTAKALAWKAQAAIEPSLSSRSTTRAARAVKSLLVPDPQVLWLPGAGLAVAAHLLPRRSLDVVLVSGPPFSSHLLGLLARLRPGVGVVLDYRDEWTTTRRVYEMAGSAAFDAVLERACLHAAHRVTTATEAFRRELLERFGFLAPENVVTIENGYDPADLELEPPARGSERLVLTYTGTVFRLTSAEGFIEGVRRLHQTEPELARLFDIRFVGRIVDTEQRHFEGSEALGIQRLGYVPHARAVEELARCHVALCLLDACEGAERIYPAKIFEILGLRRPCLALCPEGALAELVRSQQLGEVVPPRDAERIASALAGLARRFRAGELPSESEPLEPERFDRRRQAGRFARVLESAAVAGRSSRHAAVADSRGLGQSWHNQIAIGRSGQDPRE